MTLLYTILQVMVMAFFGSTRLVSDHGIATRFGDPGDPLDGDSLSCEPRAMRKGELLCAHRTLPCGTPVVVQNVRTGQVGACRVMDRGPYGATLDNGDWTLKFRKSDPGAWRGIIDLSPAMAQAIGLNGREKVRVFHPKIPKRPRAARTAPALR